LQRDDGDWPTELMPVLMMPSALTMACLIENYFCRLAMRNTSTGN
jgi:hypothetical protein